MVLYSGGPYIEGIDDYTTKTEVFAVSADECYSFVISDSYGDGICCVSGSGFYELLDENNTVLSTGGNFNFGTTDNFFNGTLSVTDFNTEEIHLYPNPSSDRITINSTNLPDYYTIYNALGQIVKQSIISFDNDRIINIKALSKGLYFIELKKENVSQTLRFIRN